MRLCLLALPGLGKQINYALGTATYDMAEPNLPTIYVT